jgi:hypothetical protein
MKSTTKQPEEEPTGEFDTVAYHAHHDKQISAALAITAAVADAIRELGSVPTGMLYVRVMDRMTIEVFTRIIDTLKRADLVTESRDVLTWVGPKGGRT